MKYGIFKEGVVVNTFYGSEAFVNAVSDIYERIAPIPDSVGIGWKEEGEGNWVSPERLHSPTTMITRRQGLLSLQEKKGVTEQQIKHLIDDIQDEDLRYKASVEFNASHWEITNPMIQVFASQLLIDEQELQYLFNYAGTL